MKAIKNIASVQEAGESRRLQPGGYVCRYSSVEDVASKEYLFMEYDIAEGEFAGYYTDLAERFGFWGGKCCRSYKEKALPMFKRMCSAVTKSNPGYIFDGNEHADEKTLVGKLVGLVLGEEEYTGNDGSTKTRLYVVREMSVDDIRAGKFKVPELKKLAAPTSAIPADLVSIPDGTPDEVPF